MKLHRRDIRKYFLILLLFVGVAIVIAVIPFHPSRDVGDNRAALGLNSPFGGKISSDPAQIVTEEELLCIGEITCQGVQITWISLIDVSCSLGSFSLEPNFPKNSTINDYCVLATADDKTSRTPATGIDRWILGLYSEVPTIIGECECFTPPAELFVVTVTADMAQVTMFGTSWW